MTSTLRPLFAALGLFLAVTASLAVTTKDVVLDRVTAPAAPAAAPNAPATTDAMAVSVLLELPDGSLVPKGTDTLFHTNDRFRVKVLASRDAKLSLYNTTPKGETSATPVWQGEVRFGQDTISPRLVLVGNSGVDKLHIVLEPVQSADIILWLGNWLRSVRDGGGTSKDIRLEVQNTLSATYMVNGNGQGLVSTVSIVHTR